LAANFSRELADYIIYIIDVSGGDKIPRKGGPGITQADLLVRHTVFVSIIYNRVHLASFVTTCTYFDFWHTGHILLGWHKIPTFLNKGNKQDRPSTCCWS
jgi:hypothetical protein